MEGTLSRFFRLQLAPPRFLTMPAAGVDISLSGIKVVTLRDSLKGVVLGNFGEELLPEGAIVRGEISDPKAVISALTTIRKKYGVKSANITLPEARTYLFSTVVTGKTKEEWRTEVEQRLDEFVPLPPSEVLFDIVPIEKGGELHVVGVAVARRIVDLTLSVFDDAGIAIEAVEAETFAVPRALLPQGAKETVLIIDFGRLTTKLSVVMNGIPAFATTLDIGGHAISLALEKSAGVTEEEAKQIKREHGLVASGGNKEYQDAIITTVSTIREEIVKRLEYWQGEAQKNPFYEPVTRAIVVGGNASLRGFAEYLESSLHIPVELGDVFSNLADKEVWLPEIDYNESLAYATVVGLALRRYSSHSL